MAIGKMARRILGENFHAVANLYRSFFVDLDLVAQSFGSIKENSKVLDLGGGDGALADLLLSSNKGITLVLADSAGRIGEAISKENRRRVVLCPNSAIADLSDRNGMGFDLVILSDVLHHVHPDQRAGFFLQLARLLEKNPKAQLAVKEIEPGFLKSKLSLWSDKYITGDRHVSLISRRELVEEMSRKFPDYEPRETELFEQNKPNYCILFKRKL